ncbi:PhoU-like phosphate uptake regulator [Anaerobacterium chartisolvens]|uniref:Phosphate-specific transport system accessory protein PhoU n=1 Tax=Anaerobacterium chartisolvens TaxID=1297424 RepID=A0A369BCZ5_9FIRM|nr:phosphate signaling complex protein PhoU [Anaerobacterium chartisolvens]RCX17544.1 PhoU-like phosphate uptake regulator [Anaerobacterium chartisolvens]
MVARHFFDRGLEELHLELIKMGSMVEESIENSILALKKQDISLAKKVFKNDDIIDELERKIERICLNLIATQQPLAKDLRTISTALKIITDMERIADHSADISEITIRMANEKYIKPLIDLPKMAELAKNMVNKSIDAYIKQDVDLAQAVCDSDDDVDSLFSKITLELINLMKNNPETVEQAIDLMLIAKYLERMADHATNIGEWVVFNVTGEHEHLAKHIFMQGLDDAPEASDHD